MKYIRFNNTYKFSPDVDKRSYVWLYLKDEIDTLLCSTIDEIPNISFDEAYIHSPDNESEKILENFLIKKDYEQQLCLTGLTGCGKTTLLKKVFRIFQHTPIIIDKTLIIPFRFDNFDSEQKHTQEENEERINERMENMILAASDVIREKYSLVTIDERTNEFVDFINDIHRDVLYFKNIRCKNDDDKIDQLFIQKRYEYAMMLLKFYLLDKNNKINNVILILDDIESISYNLQIKPIKKIYKMYDCLHNIPIELKGTYNSNCIISCRHFIFREIIDGTKSSQEMESYPQFPDIDIGGKINLIDIINKRADILYKNSKDAKKKTAIYIVRDILKKINDNSNNFILHLNLNDLRKSLSMLKELVFNYTWIQRNQNEIVKGAFTIDRYNQFNVYFANILRAIGCKNDYVYSRGRSSLPNLLHNSYGDYNPTIELLIIKYFILHKQNWNNPILTNEFFDDISVVFPNIETQNLFKKRTCNMLYDRLLLRGRDSSIKDVENININNIYELKQIYLPQITLDLWNLFATNSILLQMYLDDIFLPEYLSRNELSTYDLYKFEYCFDCLLYLIEQEKQIVVEANDYGTIKEYISCFSNESVCEQIYKGLENSISAYFDEIEDNYEQQKLYSNINLKMQICKKEIKRLENLFVVK